MRTDLKFTLVKESSKGISQGIVSEIELTKTKCVRSVSFDFGAKSRLMVYFKLVIRPIDKFVSCDSFV